jgi:hypothetical protein
LNGQPTPYQEQFLPAALIVISTAIFFAYERISPGRALPHSPNWYWRATFMNLMQLALIGLGGLTWNQYFRSHALLPLGAWESPIEIAADSLLTGFLIYCVFGGTAEAGAWTSFFGATGEYFYHANIRTPKWLGYFIQRPEHHSIHHQLDVHRYNFGDLTLWDRLFGTFKEAEAFAPACGFPGRHEERLAEMMVFKDVYASEGPSCERPHA